MMKGRFNQAFRNINNFSDEFYDKFHKGLKDGSIHASKKKYRMSDEMIIKKLPSGNVYTQKKSKPGTSAFYNTNGVYEFVPPPAIHVIGPKYSHKYDQYGVHVMKASEDFPGSIVPPIREWNNIEWHDRKKRLNDYLKERAGRPANIKYREGRISDIQKQIDSQNQGIRINHRNRNIIPAASVGAGAAIGTGIGAGIARLRSKRKVNPDETPEERKQRIRKATQKGALVGGGIGTGAGTINAIRNIRAYASNDQIRRNKISELEKSIKKLRKYN